MGTHYVGSRPYTGEDLKHIGDALKRWPVRPCGRCNHISFTVHRQPAVVPVPPTPGTPYYTIHCCAVVCDGCGAVTLHSLDVLLSEPERTPGL